MPRGDQSVATPQEREQQHKQQRKTEFDRQVDNGTLVVRQMTAEERVKYAESPEAAAEREGRRAGKRDRGRSLLHPRVVGRVRVRGRAPVLDGVGAQLEVPGLVVVDPAQPV